MVDLGDLRNRVDAIVWGPRPGSPTSPSVTTGASFSSFDLDQASRATTLASRFMEIADAKGGDAGLAAAVEEMERVLGTEIPGLVRYAVRLFLAHHAEASEKLGKR